ncbi:helix-turn-helix domain-containing protein [Adhaeribacter soli]|uniref:Helix-turn-helix transcriptional regulator n=1 Tax=Adhaeribacter soli TaxID=2607655 RepID=A0A5N1IWR7_9BACT|nr:helix-turn-helix transcriptional regulator [Adhaeribacter soli]KAA9338955.1 helix-turn-helix transcriptional regulator [Adhaeribacter soli]
MRELYQQIKAIRRARGLKQEEIASVLGIKKANLSRIENGGITLTDDKLEKLAAYFKMSIEEIASFETAHDKLLKEKQKGALENLVEQQQKQIERMKRNNENFLIDLHNHFKDQLNAGKTNLLGEDTQPKDAFEALCKIKGIKHLFNDENLHSNFPLLAPFQEYQEDYPELTLNLALKQLDIALGLLD